MLKLRLTRHCMRSAPLSPPPPPPSTAATVVMPNGLFFSDGVVSLRSVLWHFACIRHVSLSLCAPGLAVSLPCFWCTQMLTSLPAPPRAETELWLGTVSFTTQMRTVSDALLTGTEACAEYACWLSLLGCLCEASHRPAICGRLHIDCVVGKLDSECIACNGWHDPNPWEMGSSPCGKIMTHSVYDG